jgi:hypothetical protein
MTAKKIKLKQLAKKNVHINVNIPSKREWREMISKDRKIPRSFTQTRKLIRTTFGTKGKRIAKNIKPEVYKPAIRRRSYKKSTPLLSICRGSIARRFEECHEELYAYLFWIIQSLPDEPAIETAGDRH